MEGLLWNGVTPIEWVALTYVLVACIAANYLLKRDRIADWRDGNTFLLCGAMLTTAIAGDSMFWAMIFMGLISIVEYLRNCPRKEPERVR
jgi:hypothetical protein